jgi:hypothetical protein
MKRFSRAPVQDRRMALDAARFEFKAVRQRTSRRFVDALALEDRGVR